jgi:hypothetical protein
MPSRSLAQRVLPNIVAKTLTAGASIANAVQFGEVYVFGDGLSFAGYLRPLPLSVGRQPEQG